MVVRSTTMEKMAWEREELAFMSVEPTARCSLPSSKTAMHSALFLTMLKVSPSTKKRRPLLSSRTRSA